MDRATLSDLRLRWHDHVLFGTTLSPEEFAESPEARRPRCWFGEHVPGIDSCEGRIEGAHWVKRQRVEDRVRYLCSEMRSQAVHGREDEELVSLPDFLTAAMDFSALAAWDPRNGVPACEKHHRRFDGHRVDATNELVIWRHEVPGPVEAFCRDWGLELALEDRHPLIGAGV